MSPARVRAVLETIIEGQIQDLRVFPGEDEGKLAALETREDLDRYTYLVAGCVGEFWTEVHVAHRPRLRHWDLEKMTALGIRFGKALQLTNVLRDIPRDLRQGRCYLPSHDLGLLGVEPRQRDMRRIGLDLAQPRAPRIVEFMHQGRVARECLGRRDILDAMGADVSFGSDGLTVRGSGEISGLDVDRRNVGHQALRELGCDGAQGYLHTPALPAPAAAANAWTKAVLRNDRMSTAVAPLPMTTTRGDRLFIGLLGSAYINLGGIYFTEWASWTAVAGTLVAVGGARTPPATRQAGRRCDRAMPLSALDMPCSRTPK